MDFLNATHFTTESIALSGEEVKAHGLGKLNIPINELLFAKVKEEAIIPSRLIENAGYDLYACFDEDYMVIQPHETKLIPLGIATAFPTWCGAIIKERSSTGVKGMAVRAGVIDSGYRGEWKCAITNVNEKPLLITKESEEAIKALSDDYIVYPYSKAIAQFILIPLVSLTPKTISYDELLTHVSSRGEGGFGSTNK